MMESSILNLEMIHRDLYQCYNESGFRLHLRRQMLETNTKRYEKYPF